MTEQQPYQVVQRFRDFEVVYIKVRDSYEVRMLEIGRRTPEWTEVLGGLKPGGLLAITSYFDREHDLASACLLQLGARRRAELPHPRSRPLPDAPGKSVDRRLALFSAG